MNTRCLTGTGFSTGLLIVVLLSSSLTIAQTAWADTYVVRNTYDAGPGSLRQALIDANNHPGPDTVSFNIPKSDPGYSWRTNTWRIMPGSLLPSLTGGDTTIDGTTQTANQGDTNALGPEVEIDGRHLGSLNAIFYVESNANIILGLVLSRAGVGVEIRDGASGNLFKDNYIGPGPTGDGQDAAGNGLYGVSIHGGAHDNVIAHNVLSGNAGDGVMITGSDTDANKIRRNYIGLDPLGTTAVPNGRHGVSLLSSTDGPQSTEIGGQAGYRNYIGGNGEHGVMIAGRTTDESIVSHNYIGIDALGTGSVGNGGSGVFVDDWAEDSKITDNVVSGNREHGILITGAQSTYVERNIIGGSAQATGLVPNALHGVGIYGASPVWIGDRTDPNDGNVIVGNGWSGVAIVNTAAVGVWHNAIGTDKSGTATNLGNNFHGVAVVNSLYNGIIRNQIAHNGTQASGAGVWVEGSSAIENQISENSIHDNSGKGIELVDGSNAGLFTPTITQASCSQVAGTACAGCTVEVFSDAADEGRIYEGSTKTNATSTSFSWSGPVTGPNVTVTAWDSQGNTSEFSAPWTGACYRLALPLIQRRVQ